MASRIFVLLVWDRYFKAFPTRHKERWMTARTSLAGTIISAVFLKPSSRNSCHTNVSGRVQASTSAWIFISSVSCSLGSVLPRKSDMYLLALGARVVVSRSGRGCSLSRASRPSFVRQCLRCLSRYFWIDLGTFIVRESG